MVAQAHEDHDSHLFAEVNALRNGGPEIDQDEVERARLNTTIVGKIAASKKFEYTTLTVIVMNAGYLGYDGDFSARYPKPQNLYDCGSFPADECVQFAVFEVFFATYFTFEIIVRFLAYRIKRDCLSDAWFVFDSVLVTIMVIETWILPFATDGGGPLAQLSVLRLLRLLRITRMAKLMRYFPELQIIVKGMIAAVRSVMCTAILLVLILYVFSILFTSEFHQGKTEDDWLTDNEPWKPEVLFGSILKSMRNLFVMGTILDDITLCCNSILGSNKPSMIIFFILFVLVSSFTMLNMLIGILCEVVCAVGEGQRNKNTEATLKDAIQELFDGIDADQNGQISRDEFMAMKTDPNVMKALGDLEVKPKHFEMYADLMFKVEEGAEGPPTIDFEKTVAMILRLRPGNAVKSLDFASFQSGVQKKHLTLKRHLDQIEKMASILTGKDLISSRRSSVGSMVIDPPAMTPAEDLGKQPSAMSLSKNTFSVNVPKKLDAIVTDVDIILELQRRAGFSPYKKDAKMIQTCFDSDYADIHDQTDFADPLEWSKETYTC
jgi:voltage-gated sodium channel